MASAKRIMNTIQIKRRELHPNFTSRTYCNRKCGVLYRPTGQWERLGHLGWRCYSTYEMFGGSKERARGAVMVPSGGRFTESYCKLERQDRRAQRRDTLVLYSMIYREARLSHHACGY